MATSLVSINSMTDFDRGLELLNHHLHREEGVSQPNIVKELLDIDTHIEEKKQELEISKRRWDIARKISCGLTITATVGELAAVCIDQILITHERETVYWIKIAFLIGIAVTAFFFAGLTGIFQYIFGNRYEEQKSYMNEISPEDKKAIMKMRSVISSIGYLDHHRNDPIAPLDTTIKECFHCINRLPDEPINERGVPVKSDLVQVVIGVLPEEHPIRKKIKDIREGMNEERESESSPSPIHSENTLEAPLVAVTAHGFQDKGQRSFPKMALEAVEGTLYTAERAKRHWKELTQMIGGTHISSLDINGMKLINPLPQNPYATVIEVDVD